MKRARSASPKANSSKDFNVDSLNINELDNKLLKELNKTNSNKDNAENIESNDSINNAEPCSKISKDIQSEIVLKIDVKENNDIKAEAQIRKNVPDNDLFESYDADIDIDLQTECIKQECSQQNEKNEDLTKNDDSVNVNQNCENVCDKNKLKTKSKSSNEQVYKFFDESSQSDEEEGKSYHVDYVYNETKKPEYDALEARRESKRRSRRRKKFPGIKEDFENPLVQKWIARKSQEIDPVTVNTSGNNNNGHNSCEEQRALIPPTTLPGNLPPSNAASQKLCLQKHPPQNKQMINILLAAAAGLGNPGVVSPNNNNTTSIAPSTTATSYISSTIPVSPAASQAQEYMNNANSKTHQIPLSQHSVSKRHFYSQINPSSKPQHTMRLNGPVNLVPIICNPSSQQPTNIRHIISSNSSDSVTKKELLMSCSDTYQKHPLQSKGTKPALISCSTATTECVDLQSSRYDRVGHFPAIRDDPGNCQWCIETNPHPPSSRHNNHHHQPQYSSPSFSSAVACIKCGVYLCLERHRNCFLDFHTSINKPPHPPH